MGAAKQLLLLGVVAMTNTLFVWLFTSLFVAVVWDRVLYRTLRAKGLQLRYVLTSTLGYKEYHYLKWCRANGVRPGWVLVVSALVSGNMVAAGVAFVSRMLMSRGSP